MSIRSFQLVSLCAASLLATAGRAQAQAVPTTATPPAATPAPAAAAATPAPAAAAATPAPAAAAATPAPAEEKSPIEGFDLNSALVSDSGGLTADQVAKLAVGRSAQIASAQALAESARWDTKAQWVNFLPTLSLFGQYKRVNKVENDISFFPTPTPEQAAAFNPATVAVLTDLNTLFADSSGTDFTQPVDNWSTGATLRIPASDLFLRIWPAYEGSKKVAEAREIQIEATKAEIDLRAREAFYAYARAVAFRAVTEQALKQAEAQAKQTQLFVSAGTAAPVDLMNATARLEGTRGSLARADGAVAITRTALATATGLKLAEIAAIGEPVTQLPDAPTRSYDEFVASALNQRAELRALRKIAGANDHFESAEKNAAWPQLVLEGNTLYANPNPRYVPPVNEFNNTWDVSATLLWTPNQALSSHAKGKRAESDLVKARADLSALEDSVRIEVVQAYEDYKSADATARSAEAALTAAEEAYRVRLAMYRVGAGVVQDLLDADLLVTQQRLNHVTSVLDARTALARLDRAAAIER